VTACKPCISGVTRAVVCAVDTCETSQRLHCHSVLRALQSNIYFHNCLCDRHDCLCGHYDCLCDRHHCLCDQYDCVCDRHDCLCGHYDCLCDQSDADLEQCLRVHRRIFRHSCLRTSACDSASLSLLKLLASSDERLCNGTVSVRLSRRSTAASMCSWLMPQLGRGRQISSDSCRRRVYQLVYRRISENCAC